MERKKKVLFFHLDSSVRYHIIAKLGLFFWKRLIIVFLLPPNFMFAFHCNIYYSTGAFKHTLCNKKKPYLIGPIIKPTNYLFAWLGEKGFRVVKWNLQKLTNLGFSLLWLIYFKGHQTGFLKCSSFITIGLIMTHRNVNMIFLQKPIYERSYTT